MGFTSYCEAYGSLSGLFELANDALKANLNGKMTNEETVTVLRGYGKRAQQIINTFRKQQ